VQKVCDEFGIDRSRPIVTQVSRFDRLKDPVGVVQAFKLARKYVDCQLVLAGGGASDDPEGALVLKEVKEAAESDPDIIILDLPPWCALEINALQRTGMLVHSVEGCAYQIRYLLTHPEFAAQLGRNGHEHVKENFLMTTNVRRWLLLLRILTTSGRSPA
jgi:trehalose synthase